MLTSAVRRHSCEVRGGVHEGRGRELVPDQILVDCWTQRNNISGRDCCCECGVRSGSQSGRRAYSCGVSAGTNTGYSTGLASRPRRRSQRQTGHLDCGHWRRAECGGSGGDGRVMHRRNIHRRVHALAVGSDRGQHVSCVVRHHLSVSDRHVRGGVQQRSAARGPAAEGSVLRRHQNTAADGGNGHVLA